MPNSPTPNTAQSTNPRPIQFQSKKTTYIVAAIGFMAIAAAIYFLFIFQRGEEGISMKSQQGEQKEVHQIAIADRPFVTLTPTSDGAEIIISIENMGKFDAIEYELTYLADNPQSLGTKITRGATGTDVNTRAAKYKKSVLLGTASRGVRSPDTGITDGQLIMHMFIGEDEFLSETGWTFEKIGSQASTIKSVNGNFEIEVPSFGRDYWVIIADTVGVPPNPTEFTPEEIILPVYGTFSIAPTFKGTGTITIKVENQTTPKLFAYNHTDSAFSDVESVWGADTSTLTADVSNFATFVVVSQE